MPRPDFLPKYLEPAHELCLLNHDVLVEILRSGEEHSVFGETFKFNSDEERRAFEASDDVLEWLHQWRSPSESASFFRRSILPPLLSDFLHYVYEALAASRKAKLAITYTLLRKPIQEHLYLLEAMLCGPEDFARLLRENPLALRAQKAGGVPVHTSRIDQVLGLVNERDRFDAAYLATLRYNKSSDDSFDGVCNKAMHLFTEHPAIRTEQLNINFIFCDDDTRQTQWHYLYSRLPLLLTYARRVVEQLIVPFFPSDPVYLADIDRRLSAATLLWAPDIDEVYRHAAIDRFAEVTRARLLRACAEANAPAPDRAALEHMRSTGAFPAESRFATAGRHARYRGFALVNRGVKVAAGVRARGGWLYSKYQDLFGAKPQGRS